MPQMGNLTGDIEGEERGRHQRLPLDNQGEQFEQVSAKIQFFLALVTHESADGSPRSGSRPRCSRPAA